MANQQQQQKKHTFLTEDLFWKCTLLAGALLLAQSSSEFFVSRSVYFVHVVMNEIDGLTTTKIWQVTRPGIAICQKLTDS